MLLLMMTSYAIAASTLKEIKLSFRPHLSKDIKWFHHIPDAAYEINLFDLEIDFIFKDGATKARLKNNALSLLHAHYQKYQEKMHKYIS